MSLRIDKVQLDIIINNDQARQQMRLLYESLMTAQKELKQLPKDTDEWVQKSAQIAAIKAQMENVKREIGITGMTLKELTAHQRELNLVMQNMRPNTREFQILQGELQETKNRIKELKGVADQSKNMFATIFGAATLGEVAGNAITGVLTRITSGVKNFGKDSIKASLDIADAEKLLLYELEGNVGKQKELIALAQERSQNTKYTRLEVMEAEKFLVIQGRTQEQIKRTIVAATELAAHTGVTLNEAVKDLDGTMEGRLGKSLSKLQSEFRGLGSEQLANGALIDMVAQKYRNVAENEMNTHEGKVIRLEKAWYKLKVGIGDNITKDGYFDGGVTGLTHLVDAIRENMGAIVDVAKAMGTLLLGFVAYKAVILSTTAAEFIATNSKAAYATVTGLLTRAKTALTASTIANTVATEAGTVAAEGATVATEALNTATKASPWGFILGVVTAVVAAIWAYTSSAKGAKGMMEEVALTAQKNILAEKTKLEMLLKVAQDEKRSKEERQAAIEKLNKLSPEYLGNLTLDKINTMQAKDAIDAYIKSLTKKAEAEAAYQKLTEINKQLLDLKDKFGKEVPTTFWTAAWSAVSGGTQAMSAMSKEMDDLNERKKVLINLLSKEKETEENTSAQAETNLKDLSKLTAEIVDRNQKLISTQDLLNEKYRLEGLGPDQTKDQKTKLTMIEKIIAAREKESKHQEDMNKKAVDNYEAFEKEIRALQQKDLTSKLNDTQKEILDADQKYATLIAKARQFLKDNENLAPEKKAKIENDIGDLEIQKNETVKGIMLRREQEFARDIESIHEQMNVARMSMTEKALYEVDKKYDKSIEEIAQAIETSYKSQQQGLDNNLADQNISLEQWAEKSVKLEEEKDQRLAELDIETNRLNILREKEKNLAIIDAKRKLDEDISKLHTKDENREIIDPDKKAEAEIRFRYQKEIDTARKLYTDKVELATKLGQIEQLIDQEVSDAKLKRAKAIQREVAKVTIATGEKIIGTFFTSEANARQASLDATISQMEQQKEKELADKNLTEAQRQAIEDKYKKKEAAEKTKAWKAEQTAAKEQAAINGALAITNIWATTPKADFGIMTGVLIAASIAETIARIAEINSRKPPQFMAGGFTGEGAPGDVAGVVHKGEYVVPANLMKDQSVMKYIKAIEEKRKSSAGKVNGHFQTGGYVDSTLVMPSLFAPVPQLNAATIIQSISQERVQIDRQIIQRLNDLMISQSRPTGNTELKLIAEHLKSQATVIAKLEQHLSKGIKAKMYYHDWEVMNDDVTMVRADASSQ